MPLFNVFKSLPFGSSRKFAPPPSFAFIFPKTGTASMVNVAVGVSVTGNVTSIVNGTALGERVSLVEVTTFGVEVFEGAGMLVVVAGRLGIKDGSGLG